MEYWLYLGRTLLGMPCYYQCFEIALVYTTQNAELALFFFVEFFWQGEAVFQTHENLEHLAMMERVLGPLPDNLLRRAEYVLVLETYVINCIFMPYTDRVQKAPN